MLDLVARESRRRGEVIGVYPETKHPTYFDSLGLSLEEPLVAALERHHLNRPNAEVFVQSFETGNLRRLRSAVRVPLVQLVDAAGAPYDLRASADYAHAAGLDVHVWTMRDENVFMPRKLWNGTDPCHKGNAFVEYKAPFDAGVDGVFSDHADTALEAREQWLDERRAARSLEPTGS